MNLSDLLQNIDSSVSWNRRIPNALKKLSNDTHKHKLSLLRGNKVKHFKDGRNFIVQEEYVEEALNILAESCDDEMLKLKLSLKATEVANNLLTRKLNDSISSRDEAFNAVNFTKWQEYNEEI